MDNEELIGLISELEVISNKLEKQHGELGTAAVKIKVATLKLVEVITKRQAIQKAVRNISKCYIARFYHDLEDGWYGIQYPDGSYHEFNQFSTFAATIPAGTAVFWDSDIQYMPMYSVDFDKETKIWIKP